MNCRHGHERPCRTCDAPAVPLAVIERGHLHGAPIFDRPQSVDSVMLGKRRGVILHPMTENSHHRAYEQRQAIIATPCVQ